MNLSRWEMSARGKEAKNRLLLFAQELKTPVIVSVKQLEKMLAGIRS